MSRATAPTSPGSKTTASAAADSPPGIDFGQLRTQLLERLENRLMYGSDRQILEAIAKDLAADWLEKFPEDVAMRDRIFRLQAHLLYGFSGGTEDDALWNYYSAQRYLAFLVFARMAKSGCPVDAMTADYATLLGHVTVEEVRRFDAYLRYRTRLESRRKGDEYSDYVGAVDFWDAAFCKAECPGQKDCFADLRQLCATWATSVPKRADGKDRIVETKLSRVGECKRERAEKFVREFYKWVDSGPSRPNSSTAGVLLKWLSDEPTVVSVLELTLRCCLQKALAPADQR
jgi:hypothetical protein